MNTGTVGGLLTNGAGTSTSTGTLAGGASVTGGSLVLGAGSVVTSPVSNAAVVTAQGRIDGAVTNAAGARFTLTGPLAGVTQLTNAGTVSLAGNALSLGTLAAGAGGVIQNGAAAAATLTVTAGGYGGTLQDGPGGGALGLTKAGAGTLTLSGSGSYTGPTLVQAGTLALAGTGSLAGSSGLALAAGSSFSIAGLSNGGAAITCLADGAPGQAGSVQLGANTLTLTNAAGTFGGTIIGTGGLTLAGGTQVLTGTNAYSGPTWILAGTLVDGAGGALSAASAFTLANGATLDLAGFDHRIASLAGAGTVTNNGAAAVRLSVGGEGTTTFAGALADGVSPIGLTKVGTGTLTLAGLGTYTGDTLITKGTLAITNPNAIGTGVLLMDEATRLAFIGSGYTLANAIRFTGREDPTIDSGPGTVAISGRIAGPGIIEKAGSGTLVLLADNSYTGLTRIAQGTLQVDGSIAASPLVTAAPGAVLSGIGRVGGILAQSGAIVAPGNPAVPYGTLTAEGAVTFAAGSALAVNTSPTAASHLATTATATIAPGGILQISPGPMAYTTPLRLPILTASGGLTGQFTTIVYTAPVQGQQPSVLYSGNTSFLQFGDTQINPRNPSPDLTSAIASARDLARDRIGAFVTQRVIGSVLTGATQQVSCGDCFSGFGMAGSYSIGAQGRRAITEDLIAIGGFSLTGYDSGRVQVPVAPIFAGLLRYDPANLGPARPFVDVGGLVSPGQPTTYSRPYTFGNLAGVGVGRTSTTSASLFGRVGYVARLSPQDEIAASAEIARGWQYVGAYSETVSALNPYPLVSRGGTDSINIAKVGGQWTHLFGAKIETQFGLGVAQGFCTASGLRAAFGDLPVATPVGNATWAEYSVRASYRVNQELALDAFVLGTLGAQPIGNTIHGGVSARYAF
ncbi:autotransporter-associated beta strand repeat-containing protein [Methylobacterium sp. E-016]|uniref:autotransporter-associated beta strand repeat-containing protein n=1 Tax=Methylobacterium sp. E-016 TaxID=2836556 RepID=UPI001FBBB211|nr:autotransporter-associated beta strand repeat-containing protein [Methylobacterium sp. E-016]MCJ2077091.1 autotransporter-associated beta strand repeat-containing protein [Methylobacterium sp. E-016]